MLVSISNPASASPTLIFITMSAPAAAALVGSADDEDEKWW